MLQEGVACHRSGDLAGAERSYRKVLKKNPRDADALHLLGLILNQSGKGGDGAASIKAALAVRDNFPDAHLNLAIILAQSGDAVGAEHHFRRAVFFRPSPPVAQINLGLLLRNLGRIEEATGCFEAAIRVDPRNIEAHVELARTKRFGNDAGALLTAAVAALRLAPNHALLHVMAAEALFGLDRLGEAWREYRFRFQSSENTVRAKDYPLPLWHGEPLTGLAILVWTEQAPGDEIMYANMIQDVVDQAQRCVVQCSPRLAPLLRRSFPKAEVFDRDLTAAELRGLDVHAPLGSAGEWLRPGVASFPAHAGYLKPDPDLRDRLRSKYTCGDVKKLVVGISWRSVAPVNGADKSLNVLEWGPILHVPGTVFVNLQYGNCDTDLAAVKSGFGVTVIQDETIDSLKDMDSYAAQVAAMDVVVSSSNTAAHVAGALGIPTLCMLPASLARGRRWYWLAQHQPCPWYPAMRSFIQRLDGSWSDVIRDAGLAVLDMAAARGAAEPAAYLRAMAQALIKIRRPGDAEAFYRRLAEEPGHAAEGLFWIAELKLAVDPQAALALADQAIAADPGYWLAHNIKGRIFNLMRRFEDAVGAFQEGLRHSSAVELRANLGKALAQLGHGAEARRELGQAFTESRGADETTRNAIALNYAGALNDAGEPDAAIAVLRDLIAAAPGLVDAHYNLALILLSLGRFEEGWPEISWRLQRPNMAPYRNIPLPPWSGQDLSGKKIVVWTEQGIGDEIIVASMVPDAAATAKQVVLLCSERMVPLMRRSFPEALVEERKEPLPKAATTPDIACQMSLSDLGGAFRRSFADFPARSSFLIADSARREALRRRYAALRPGAPVIGISWSSRQNPEVGWLKSVNLADWHPILRTPGVTFVNLQYGDWTAKLADIKAQTGVEIVQDPDVDPLKDMDAFAAQVAAMDLVISVSNTTVHVAGALGVPTWVMPPQGRGRMWYWFRDRTDCPWYSSVRLLDSHPEGWGPVIERCGRDLGDWVKARTS